MKITKIRLGILLALGAGAATTSSMAQHDPLPNGIKGVQVAAGATDSGTTGAGTGTAGTGTGATTSPAGGDSSAPGAAGAGPARTGATDNTGNPAGAGASNTGAGGVDGGKGGAAGTLIDETTQPTTGANDQAKDEGANKRGTPASASHGKDTDATDTSSGKSATPTQPGDTSSANKPGTPVAPSHPADSNATGSSSGTSNAGKAR